MQIEYLDMPVRMIHPVLDREASASMDIYPPTARIGLRAIGVL